MGSDLKNQRNAFLWVFNGMKKYRKAVIDNFVIVANCVQLYVRSYMTKKWKWKISMIIKENEGLLFPFQADEDPLKNRWHQPRWQGHLEAGFSDNNL